MDIILTIMISIIAGVICHYICKWLDRDKSDKIEWEAVTDRRPLTAPYVPFGIRRFQWLTCTD